MQSFEQAQLLLRNAHGPTLEHGVCQRHGASYSPSCFTAFTATFVFVTCFAALFALPVVGVVCTRTGAEKSPHPVLLIAATRKRYLRSPNSFSIVVELLRSERRWNR